MDEVKKTYREAEETAKETWRGIDGTSPEDSVRNAGDDLAKHAGNAADKVRSDAAMISVTRRRSGIDDSATRSTMSQMTSATPCDLEPTRSLRCRSPDDRHRPRCRSVIGARVSAGHRVSRTKVRWDLGRPRCHHQLDDR